MRVWVFLFILSLLPVVIAEVDDPFGCCCTGSVQYDQLFIYGLSQSQCEETYSTGSYMGPMVRDACLITCGEYKGENPELATVNIPINENKQEYFSFAKASGALGGTNNIFLGFVSSVQIDANTHYESDTNEELRFIFDEGSNGDGAYLTGEKMYAITAPASINTISLYDENENNGHIYFTNIDDGVYQLSSRASLGETANSLQFKIDKPKIVKLSAIGATGAQDRSWSSFFNIQLYDSRNSALLSDNTNIRSFEKMKFLEAGRYTFTMDSLAKGLSLLEVQIIKGGFKCINGQSEIVYEDWESDLPLNCDYQEQTVAVPVLCEDSDGRDITTKGTVFLLAQSKELVDFCDDSVLTEFTCNGNIETQQQIPCEFGCSEGACVAEPEPLFYIYATNTEYKGMRSIARSMMLLLNPATVLEYQDQEMEVAQESAKGQMEEICFAQNSELTLHKGWKITEQSGAKEVMESVWKCVQAPYDLQSTLFTIKATNTNYEKPTFTYESTRGFTQTVTDYEQYCISLGGSLEQTIENKWSCVVAQKAPASSPPIDSSIEYEQTIELNIPNIEANIGENRQVIELSGYSSVQEASYLIQSQSDKDVANCNIQKATYVMCDVKQAGTSTVEIVAAHGNQQGFGAFDIIVSATVNEQFSSIAACNDGRDNDNDGKIDYPYDPGCLSLEDIDETDLLAPGSQCSDGIDNDNDGKIDFPNDPGCDDILDNDETDVRQPVSECNNGKDDDGDGYFDFDGANSGSRDRGSKTPFKCQVDPEYEAVAQVGAKSIRDDNPLNLPEGMGYKCIDGVKTLVEGGIRDHEIMCQKTQEYVPFMPVTCFSNTASTCTIYYGNQYGTCELTDGNCSPISFGLPADANKSIINVSMEEPCDLQITLDNTGFGFSCLKSLIIQENITEFIFEYQNVTLAPNSLGSDKHFGLYTRFNSFFEVTILTNKQSLNGVGDEINYNGYTIRDYIPSSNGSKEQAYEWLSDGLHITIKTSNGGGNINISPVLSAYVRLYEPDPCPNCQQSTCTDTDGGKNYFVKGTTNTKEPNGYSSTTNDSCWGIDGQTLYENYCENGIAKSDPFVECEFGCSQGRCLQAKPTCTDTDSNDDKYIRGYTTIDQGKTKVYDQCGKDQGYLNNSMLIQSYCDGHKLELDYTSNCEFGCENGACIIPEVVIEPEFEINITYIEYKGFSRVTRMFSDVPNPSLVISYLSQSARIGGTFDDAQTIAKAVCDSYGLTYDVVEDWRTMRESSNSLSMLSIWGCFKANQPPEFSFPNIQLTQDSGINKYIHILDDYVNDSEGDNITYEIVSQSHPQIVKCNLTYNSWLSCETIEGTGESQVIFELTDGTNVQKAGIIVSVVSKEVNTTADYYVGGLDLNQRFTDSFYELSEKELPSLLKTQSTTSYEYIQSVYSGQNAKVIFDNNHDVRSFDTPIPYFSIDADPETLWKYVLDVKEGTLDFTTMDDQIEMFGKKFTVDDTINSKDKITLYTSQKDVFIEKLNEPQYIEIDGKSHTLELVGGSQSDSKVILSVNGQRKTVYQGYSGTVGGLDVFVEDTFVSTIPTDSVSAKLQVGSTKIELPPSNSDCSWSNIEINDDAISGMDSCVVGAGNDDVEQIHIWFKPSQLQGDIDGFEKTELLVTDQFITDPLFGTVVFTFAGPSEQLTASSKSNIELNAQSKSVNLNYENHEGIEVSFEPFTLYNSQLTTTYEAEQEGWGGVILAGQQAGKDQIFALNYDSKTDLFEVQSFKIENGVSYVRLKNLADGIVKEYAVNDQIVDGFEISYMDYQNESFALNKDTSKRFTLEGGVNYVSIEQNSIGIASGQTTIFVEAYVSTDTEILFNSSYDGEAYFSDFDDDRTREYMLTTWGTYLRRDVDFGEVKAFVPQTQTFYRYSFFDSSYFSLIGKFDPYSSGLIPYNGNIFQENGVSYSWNMANEGDSVEKVLSTYASSSGKRPADATWIPTPTGPTVIVKWVRE